MKQKDIETLKRIKWLTKFCKDNGILFNEFFTKSFRLIKVGFNTIDVFPKSGKCFLHETESWMAPENWQQSIESYFRIASKKLAGNINDDLLSLKQLSKAFSFKREYLRSGLIKMTKQGCISLLYDPKKKTVQFSDCEETGEVTDLERFLTFQFSM